MEKYFTIQEANRSLALVRPIVSDILTKMKEAKRLHNEVKQEKSQPNGEETFLLQKLHAVEKFLNDVEHHIQELESVGAELKDLERGLVDFPCMVAGRTVYLCWMPEESEISAWHEKDAGYAGRKSLQKSLQL